MRLSLLCLLLLCACTPEVFVPNQSFEQEGVEFEVSPDREAACGPDQFFQAKLRWNVRDFDDAKLDIKVGSSDGKLFARVNKAQGEELTERWVTTETWFVLVDRSSGQVLAAAQSEAPVCDRPDAK